MTYHFDLNLWQILAGSAVLFFAAIGVALVCFCIIIDAFRLRFPLDVETPSVSSDDGSVDSPTVHIGQIVPVPQQPVDEPVEVHVGEVIAAPRRDELPPPPVTLDDAPIFASVPFTLPFTADFSFNWMQPWTLPTGEFPVIEAAQDPPKARERFATTKRKGGKRVTVDVGGDVRSEDMAVA